MRTKRRTIAAIAAAVLAILGIIALVAYANGADDRAFEGTTLVPAIRVVKDVPAGTKAADLGDAVEVVELPKAAVPATALTTLDPVTALVTTAALVPGEVLVSGRFGDADGDSDDQGGAATVPEGMQELTIRLSSVRALGGSLEPGDTVGVAATYDPERETNFAVNKVLVLSSKAAPAAADGASDDVVVRLAADSLDAAKIVHAAELGHIYLTKQGDDAQLDRRLVTSESVLR
ncbi:MAG: RcpC/CpaB family pilus assembly protein [Aeromicrobium sp.]